MNPLLNECLRLEARGFSVLWDTPHKTKSRVWSVWKNGKVIYSGSAKRVTAWLKKVV